jgi:hypothetical protein
MGYVRLHSDKTINKIVSHLPGVKAAVADAALEIGVKAEANLALHRDTGAASIEVEQGRVDSYVYLVDDAAMSIEFGHWVGGKYKTDKPRHVEGLYIISRAAGII